MQNYIYFVLFLAFFLLAAPANSAAAVYTVGSGQSYSSLLQLFSSSVLAENDTIILNSDDYSLAGRMIFHNFSMQAGGTGQRIFAQAAPISGSQPGGLLYVNNFFANLTLQDIIIRDSAIRGPDNTASSGRGGAFFGIYSFTVNSNGNTSFINNTTSGGASTGSPSYQSALGGAIYSSNNMVVNINPGSTLTFDNNQVNSGNLTNNADGSLTALGSAMLANTTLAINNNGTLYIINNKAYAGNAEAGASNSRSAIGGAIYSGDVTFSGGGNYYFSNNLAQGGNSDNAISSLSGRGGVVYANNLYLDGSGSYTFTNNIARGGNAFNNGNASNSGLGGALSGDKVYLSGTAVMSFDGNKVYDGNTAAYSTTAQAPVPYSPATDLRPVDPLQPIAEAIPLGTGGNSSYAARGGAIFANTLTVSQQGAMNFSNNLAQGQNGAYSGMAGAIYGTTLNIGGSGTLVFSNNSAVGGSGNGSAWGGALAGTTLNLSRDADVYFNDNQAVGGSGTQNAFGGAVKFTNINLSGSGDIYFNNNTAQGGSGASSAYGGAIYVQNLQSSRSGTVYFNNNRAMGGGGAGSGYGGAIFAGGLLNLENMYFEGNSAPAFSSASTDGGLGGAIFANSDATLRNAQFNSNSARSGGAIYARALLNIEDTVFTGNSAAAFNSADVEGGRGGAIFVQASDNDINLIANTNILFSNNTQSNGGQPYNSIYFGNNENNDYSINLNVQVAEGGRVTMLDPMASQPDNMAGNNGLSKGNVALNINKSGSGGWLLAGYNYLPGNNTFTVSQGSLYMAESAAGPAVIDLALSNTSAFTVDNSADLLLGPTYKTYQINAGDIDLASGSRIVLDNRMRYNLQPEQTEFIYLKLRAQTSLLNNSLLGNSNGIMPIGFYNYDYTLTWRENNPLSMDLLLALADNPTYVPSREAVAATTAPTAIAAYNQNSSLIFKRIMHTFSQQRDHGVSSRQMLAMLGLGNELYEENGLSFYADSARSPQESGLEADEAVWTGGAGGGSLRAGQSSLWFLPAFSHTSNSGLSGYTIKTPTWMMGYDHWFADKFFVGAAIAGALPEYESNDADVSAKNISGFLYGGALLPAELELGAFLSYGHTSYDQTRRTDNVTYGSDYASDNFSAGLSLARSFSLSPSLALRPYVNYEYMRLNVDEYGEQWGEFALSFDSHRENLHFVKAGLDLAYTFEQGAYVAGQLYYSGLFGDRQPENQEYFVMDLQHTTFISHGDTLDQNSLGVGLSAGVPLGEALHLSLGYNFLKGENNTTHQANLNFVIKF